MVAWVILDKRVALTTLLSYFLKLVERKGVDYWK